MKTIVIFASGNGTNAEEIILFFKKMNQRTVVAIGSNNLDAKVLSRAKKHNVNTFTFTINELNNGSVLSVLNEINPNLIVLAGFLLKFPKSITDVFKDRILNIHPALLPKYGGKGMYGNFVHEAVFFNKEKESGITIHYVNENYDEGDIIFQQSINIEDCNSADEIAKRIHQLEYKYFPEIINKVLDKQ
mgnify:FL=1